MHLMNKSLIDDTSDIEIAGRMSAASATGLRRFAQSTKDAVRNGSLAAVCGAIERAAKTMRSAGYRPKIVLTGGDASRILKELEGNIVHRPNLVLQGLAFMLRNKP
jgi:pantothenate kinase type III